MRRGLTLIEVQLAMMLLLVGVLTAVAVAPTGLRSVRQSEKSTLTVAYYTRHILEATMALKFSHQVSVASTRLETVMSGVPADTYTYTVTVATLPDNAEIHSIQVVMNWTDSDATGNPLPRSVKLVGYSAKTD